MRPTTEVLLGIVVLISILSVGGMVSLSSFSPSSTELISGEDIFLIATFDSPVYVVRVSIPYTGESFALAKIGTGTVHKHIWTIPTVTSNTAITFNWGYGDEFEWNTATTTATIVPAGTIPTTLSISAPSSSSVGSSYTVSGYLRDGTTTITGRTVSLWTSIDGGASWYSLGAVSTTSTGYSKVISPTVDGEYRIKTRFSGDATYSESESSVVITTVAPGTSTPILSISVSPTNLTLGSSVRITGSLSASGGGGLDGRSVEVKYSTGGSWTSVGTRTTEASGSFSAVDWTPAATGTYSVKASFGGDSSGSVRYLAVDSSSITVTVRPVTSDGSGGGDTGTGTGGDTGSGDGTGGGGDVALISTSISVTHPASILEGESVDVSGRLTGTAGLSGKTVKVDVKREGGEWNTLGTLTTASDGSFSVSRWTPSRVTAYQIRATFIGDTTYASSQSTSSLEVVAIVSEDGGDGLITPPVEDTLTTVSLPSTQTITSDPIMLTGIIIVIGIAMVMLVRRKIR